MTLSTEQSVETGHSDVIHDAQINFYGTQLATCSSDRTIKIFDLRQSNESSVQTLNTTLQGHEGPVWQVAWANPRFGNILASCSYDRKVIFWREENGQWAKLHEFAHHDSSVNSISFSPYQYGLMLACGSSDGVISIVSYSDATQGWQTEKIVNAHPMGCNAVTWDPNTTAGSACGGVRRIASGGCDNKVKIWVRQCSTAKESSSECAWSEEHKLEGHSDWVRDVAWAPYIGSRKNVLASCSQDHRVLIWTSDVDAPSAWTCTSLNEGENQPAFSDVVWHLSWSITGNVLAVSSGDNRITLWKRTFNSSGSWKCISDSNDKGNGNNATGADSIQQVPGSISTSEGIPPPSSSLSRIGGGGVDGLQQHTAVH